MDDCEKLIVQHHFAQLVQEGQAEYMLDELYSAGVLTLDDFQRVQAAVTDSDKMRTLLNSMLRKNKTSGVRIFPALVTALKKAQRSDVADALMRCYESKLLNCCVTNGASPLAPPICHGNQGGFTFSSELTASRENHGQDGQSEGMDVTDYPQKMTTSTKEATLFGTISTGKELSTPAPDCQLVQPGLVLTPKDLQQMKELAKRVSGKFCMQGRVFFYEIHGVFESGRLMWCVRLTDSASGRCVEKTAETNREELLESCLRSFTTDSQ